MRWTLTAGIAAALVVTAILGFTSLTVPSVSAAEALTQAGQTSTDYKGWIHIRTAIDGDKDYSITHCNNQTGAWASEQHIGGTLEITMYTPAEKKVVTYSSKDGIVKIGELNENFATSWKEEMQNLPLTFAAGISKFPSANVRESSENNLRRFDVSFPNDTPEKAKQEDREPLPQSAIIWADPATKLVTKSQIQGTTTEISTFTYGDPAIKDIYDLAIPRTTPIIDNRPTPETNALLDRLQKHADNAFGDSVALVTETDIGADGKPEQSSAHSLYARSGKMWYAARFLHIQNLAVNPSLDTLLATFKNQSPSTIALSDGTLASANLGLGLVKLEPKDIRVYRSRIDLSTWLWPTRYTLGTFGSDAKVELIADNDHPKLIGLRVDQIIQGRQMQNQKTVKLYWIDPARDDALIESLIQTYSPNGQFVENEVHTFYSDFTKIPAGQTYPSTWKTTILTRRRNTQTENVTTYRLQIWPGEKLSAEWFQDPAHNMPAK